jgi:hypothetical protein
MSKSRQNSVKGGFLQNKSRIRGDVLSLLLKDFAYFNELGQRLDHPLAASPVFSGRLLSYVVDGEGSVLDDIRTRQGWTIASVDNDEEARAIRWRIYDHWDKLPPRMLIRFGQTLAQSSSVVLGCPRLDLSADRPWVEALARDLIGLPVSHEMFWRTRGFTPHPKASVRRLGALMETDGLEREALTLSAFTSVAGRAPDGCDFLGALPDFGAEMIQLKPALAPLFRHEDADVRLRALSLLATAPQSVQSAFAPDAAPEVETEAEVEAETKAIVESLSKAAAAELKKRAPAKLKWFPFAQLPTVHWDADNEAVSPEVIQWLVILAHRLKSPEPTAMMRRYCKMFLQADAETLGVFTLGAWMVHDLTSGARASEGVLALVAACGGESVATMAQLYLDEWGGARPAQGEALSLMLDAVKSTASQKFPP